MAWAEADSQAVDHGAALATVPLPAVHLGQQAEEGLPGVGHVAVRRPAQELEVAHHQLALLELGHMGNATVSKAGGHRGDGVGPNRGGGESKALTS